MKNLDLISEELFNKIRGRFPTVTIGNAEGIVTNKPNEARFFDFDFKQKEKSLGRVSVSLDENSVSVMYSNNFVENQDKLVKQSWYDFLKELRYFAKKRLLNFDTRDITKSNLNKNDYKFLAQNQSGEEQMTESKMYGTSRTSYQDVGSARVSVRHNQPVNQELASGRTQHIENIYIESSEGERFKYPFKHLNGARAMAMHVSEGGKVYDDFGKHITGLSEELYKLKKFKSYMGRSGVMAEGLSQYMDIVNERVLTVKKTIEGLQRQKSYQAMIENFEVKEIKEVPEDVAENWVDQLTIRQFNEELKDVFPYIYNLVNEETKAQELGPEDIVDSVEETTESTASDHEDDFNAFEEWADDTVDSALDEGYMKGYQKYNCKDCGCQMHNCKPDCDCSHDSHDESGSWWRDANGNGVPDVMEGDSDTDEGNAYAHAVRQAKMDGKKKGDKVMGPDGEEITIETVTDYVLSMYDRHTGQFPKGETAVLTAVEKDFGESFINPAKQFIEAINAKFEEYNGYKDPELMDNEEFTLEGFLSNLDEKLKKGDEEMLLALYNTYKDNPMIPKKYRDLMGRVKDELSNKAAAKRDAGKVADKSADDKLDAFGGPGPDIKPTKSMPDDPAKPQADPEAPSLPKKSFQPDYDSSGSEVTGKYGMQSTAYDPNYNGPEGYLNDADAIEGLMSSSSLSSEEDQWLNMAYVKYNITRDNLGQVLQKIRKDVARKAASDVSSFDKSQESVELENIRHLAGI